MDVAALKQVEGVYRIDAESNGEPPRTVVARTQEPLPTARQEVPLRRQELDRVTGTYAANGINLKVGT